MDLSTADPATMAKLVLSGKLQLDEIPSRNRISTAEILENMKKEQTAKAAETKTVEIPKNMVTMTDTKAEIMAALDSAEIKYDPDMTKSDLLKLLHGEDVDEE